MHQQPAATGELALRTPGTDDAPVGAPPGLISTARQIEARNRLDAELRAIALDLLGLFPADELPRECAAWVRATIEAAVAQVSDPTVAVLALRLRSALGDAPADVARRVEAARLRHEAGYA
jgi:hypothetical protein